VADGDVAGDTAIVVVVGPAVDVVDVRDGKSFVDFVLGIGGIAGGIPRGIDPRIAENHHPAPQPALVNPEVAAVVDAVEHRRENDGIARFTAREDLATAGDYEGRDGGRAGVGRALDQRARLDVQYFVGFDINEPVQDVSVGAVP